VSTEILTPREYQNEVIDENFDDRNVDWLPSANTLATGLGKTVIFSWIAYLVATMYRLYSGRTLILVHRDELVNQTVAKLMAVSPTLRVGVIKGKRHETEEVDVIVASVQSLGRADMRRLKMMSPRFFEWIVVDECHHSTAPSYVRILEYFGGLDPDVPVKVSGFTATLQRADGGLGKIYNKVLKSGKDILWGIRNGYLVDVRGKRITLDNLHLDQVAKLGGDYSEKGLGAALTAADYAPVVAHALVEYASDRQSMVFSPTVPTAFEVTEELRGRGRSCAIVTGSTPLEERALIYKKVRHGEIQDLVNCRVFTEGFDMPQLSVAVIPPTTNQPVFVQEAGRVLRPYTEQNPNSPYPWMRTPKKDALLLLVGDGTTKLMSLPDLSEFTKNREVQDEETLKDATDRIILEEKVKGRIIDLGRVRVEDVEFFTKSRSAWLQTRAGFWFIQTPEWIIAMYPEDTTEQYFRIGRAWCGKGKRQKGGTIAKHVSLDYGRAWAEELASSIDPIGTYAKKDASWRRAKREPATAPQLGKLRDLKVQHAKDLTKVEASELISIAVASAVLDGYRVPTPEVEDDTDD
jgi:superfamily II DNA or RNA helicase